MELTETLTYRVAKKLSGENLTLKDIVEFLVRSNLVDNYRLRQFLAVSEFYDRYGNEHKSAIVKQLAVKYDIAEKTLYNIIGQRRFKI